MQAELATVVHEGKAARGKVRIVVNGNREICDVKIDDEMLGNKEKLESAVKDAFKDATGMGFQMKLAKKMQEMGGMDMLKNLG